MSKTVGLAIVVALAGCYSSYYVADVHTSGGELVMTKCAFDDRGHTTDTCHDEPVTDDSPVANDSSDDVQGPPDAADLAAVQRELASQAPVARPAPSHTAIARALGATGVHRLVELCRGTYASEATTLRFSVTVTPAGDVTDTSRTRRTRGSPTARYARCAPPTSRRSTARRCTPSSSSRCDSLAKPTAVLVTSQLHLSLPRLLRG